MKVVYSARYHIDVGNHIFPTRKYQLLHDRLLASPLDVELVEPDPAGWDELARVHTPDYLRKVRRGGLTMEEIAQLEIPWSPDIVEGFRLMTGGTVAAARLAANGERIVAHLGGGFHHAFADHGEGFCLFNDVAVAVRVLAAQSAAVSAAIVDLDVHHGNGTAMIFAGDGRVFTFSMHQQHNYPAVKPPSTLDMGLPDRTRNAEYLQLLRAGLDQVFAHAPAIVFYLAGADPYEDDQLGGLALTKSGLRERDREVLAGCVRRGVPVVLTLAGGYARRLEDTVDIHLGTVEEAAAQSVIV